MAPKPKELRDYQEAILRAMEDGLPHHRDELTRIGIAAIDPQYALSMYQQAKKNKAEERFEGLVGEARFAEIERQRYEGAKMQISKCLSHLEDGRLLEVVEFAPPTRANGRPKRVRFRITDRGRSRLSGASDEQLDASWEDDARQALVKVAQEMEFFTVDDIWASPLPRPLIIPSASINPLDRIMAWGTRQGFIAPTDMTTPRPYRNNSMRVWESRIAGHDEIEWLRCNICGNLVDPMDPGTSSEAIYNVPVFRDENGSGHPFAPEPTGNHTCEDCSRHLKDASRRGRKDPRQSLRDKLATRM